MKSTRKTRKALLWGALISLLTFIPVSQAVAQTCVLPPSGLIGWWDGDAVSGTTATDIQAGNDGILVGETTTAQGQVGDAFSFDGNGDFVQLPFDSGVVPNQFTIDAWVFPTKLTRFSFLQGIVDNDTTNHCEI